RRQLDGHDPGRIMLLTDPHIPLRPRPASENGVVGIAQPDVYRAELSVGRACRYRPVVATEEGARVAWARWVGAARSEAWVACAWRSQCGDTFPIASSSARSAARRTMRKTADGSRWRPRRERKTGSWSAASPRSDTRSRHTSAGSSTVRVLPPLPKTVI